MVESLFWYDYETSGLDSRADRVFQFAGIRTDLELNIIDEPRNFYCRPTGDVLPSPDACMVTGISPRKLEKEGLSEVDFASRILKEFAQPNTCTLGYNNLRFDDEFTRFLFYRCLHDPYAREWQNGNSRWDILGLVQIAYALRPEGINWPVRSDGKISLRLEDLSKANDLAHDQAHDALSDVHATIGIARLIREKQPKLFDFLFTHRRKQQVSDLLMKAPQKVAVLSSSMITREKGHLTVVKPLFVQQENKNAVVVFNLRHDPEQFVGLGVDELREQLFASSVGKEVSRSRSLRSALMTVKINQCPVVVPLNTLTNEACEKYDINLETMLQRAQFLEGHADLIARLHELVDEPREQRTEDPELALYSGGFLGNDDRARLQYVHRLDANGLADEGIVFDDPRYGELLFRFRARNYPESLNPDEQRKWREFRREKLLEPEHGFGLGWEEFQQRINKLKSDPELDPGKQDLLSELEEFGQELVDSLH